MNIQFYNTPAPLPLSQNDLPKIPDFLEYRPDFARIEELVNEYADYANVLIVGHGGSVTSAYALYNTLKYSATKPVYFLSTVDPDYITELKTTLVPGNTVVIAVTKSGENTTQLEAWSQFFDYPVIVITGAGSSVERVAEKLKMRVVRHPVIGGRYTAFTEVSLLPLAMAGIDVDAVFRGAREMQQLYSKDNLAFKAASVLYQLEQNGYVDVLGLVYSHYLFSTSLLITQLCHESFGKSEKGQTYSFAEGSEVQHHTVQRFLGGRKNMVGLFLGLHHFNSALKSSYPPQVHSVPFREHPLFDINNIPLGQAQNAELSGTLEDARMHNIPVIHMELTALDPMEVGRFIAFWQLFAVYSSVLRGVNPFDQPAVENGKRISFSKRLAFKGLL